MFKMLFSGNLSRLPRAFLDGSGLVEAKVEDDEKTALAAIMHHGAENRDFLELR